MATIKENLGPAERIIQSILTYSDHMFHGRPGIVTADVSANVGVKWEPVTHKVENDQKVAYKLTKQGKKTIKTRVGVIGNDNIIRDGIRVVGQYRPSGIFPEVAAWIG